MLRRLFVLGLGSLLLLLVGLYNNSLAGSYAYNRYHVALADYIQKVSVDSTKPFPIDVYEWHRRSINMGHRQSAEELRYLQSTISSQWPVVDPLHVWLGIQDWNGRNFGRPLPDSVWEFAHKGETRIEAEEMLTAGVRLPNPYVSYRNQNDGTEYVALFWGLTSLEIPFAILHDGQYRITIRAKDWPPSPLIIRVRINDQEQTLQWDEGDRNWRDKAIDMQIPRGLHNLRITYMPPAGNRTQKASIDHIDFQRID